MDVFFIWQKKFLFNRDWHHNPEIAVAFFFRVTKYYPIRTYFKVSTIFGWKIRFHGVIWKNIDFISNLYPLFSVKPLFLKGVSSYFICKFRTCITENKWQRIYLKSPTWWHHFQWTSIFFVWFPLSLVVIYLYLRKAEARRTVYMLQD
jgi:hypothetical protein